ncbi:acyl-CoA reductase [Rhizobium anhuiense]|uniref:Acyl-CoA reductase n=1 Tax=Rhizobium anhuiense TaxID=1184720 RepID=A0ABX4J7W8_9HYPH|nr:acyl-CoA reductase [Rhizobium anhuiense]PDS43962.1 acyl-CoA reductase [Rhizobium anhuiense]PDS51336.1 acyl-CoA reductase [Rhizobium anhuiense]
MPIIRDDRFEAGDWLKQFDLSSRHAFFDERVVDFLHELSRRLMKDNDARHYPDLVTFAYFCRKANLRTLSQQYRDAEYRSGWGTVAHIAPSNIPVNFAFSLVFGMLSGNSNIVRMPSKAFPQNDIFLRAFDGAAESETFRSIAVGNVFIQTARGSAKLKEIVAAVDGLTVWGGDATVAEFRSLPKKPRSVELYFPDRTSSAAIDASAYSALETEQKTKLARDFFNDTYLVDQNACSSPSQIFWLGEPAAIAKAKVDFWPHLDEELHRQDFRLDTVARLDKFLDLMNAIRTTGGTLALNRYSPDIWCIGQSLPKETRLRFGQFAEIDVQAPSDIAAFLRPQEQTLTYFGLQPQALFLALQSGSANHAIDRIVPIGKALDINPFWDGKDILSLLSRRIEIVEGRENAAISATALASFQT